MVDSTPGVSIVGAVGGSVVVFVLGASVGATVGASVVVFFFGASVGATEGLSAVVFIFGASVGATVISRNMYLNKDFRKQSHDNEI